MAETGEEQDLPEQEREPASLQSEEELEHIINKELEDMGKDLEDTNEKEDPILAQQRTIDEELRKLRKELDVDSASPDISQEYDVAARVKQLNEELAKEGPIEEKKNRKVFFNENVVSMAIPPPEYPDEDVKDEECERLLDGRVSEKELEVDTRNNASEEANSREVVPQDIQERKLTVSQDWIEGNNDGNKESQFDLLGDESKQELKLGESEQIEGSQESLDNLPNRTDGDRASEGHDGHAENVDEQVYALQGGMKRAAEQHISQATDTTQSMAQTSSNMKYQKNENDDPNDLEMDRLTLVDRSQRHNDKTLPSRSNVANDSIDLKEASEDEHILIERGGTFFYIDVQDLSPEERENLGVTLSRKSKPNFAESKLPMVQPQPPERPRPSTATGGGVRVVHQRQMIPRATSAKTSKEYDKQECKAAKYEEPFGNTHSKYGMTADQKKFRLEQARLRAQKAAEEKEKEEHEKREKEEMCEGVFKAWVEKKKEEAIRQKYEERQRKKQELKSKEERFPQEAYNAWLARKKQQMRAQRNVMQKMGVAEREAYFIRSREECEQAFREWRRSKTGSLLQSQSMVHGELLESKRRARQSRKSRNLAKAIEVAQKYRYNEYYGYRF